MTDSTIDNRLSTIDSGQQLTANSPFHETLRRVSVGLDGMEKESTIDHRLSTINSETGNRLPTTDVPLTLLASDLLAREVAEMIAGITNLKSWHRFEHLKSALDAYSELRMHGEMTSHQYGGPECKNHGRCDHRPGDLCFERRVITESIVDSR